MEEMRKTLIPREVVRQDWMGTPCDQVTRVAALAVIRNPLAGQVVEDLTSLCALGAAVIPSNIRIGGLGGIHRPANGAQGRCVIL